MKDPAFLFYSSDFLTGTMFMSNEQVGQYIRLLCAQHQKGRLSEKHMLSICKAYDKDIFEKFKKDGNGLYYNKRLEDEQIRRVKYSESRRNNAKGKRKIIKKPPKAYAEHMETETEDENETINRTINEVKYPFDSKEFFNAWNLWCDFKKEQFRFTYKPIGEQKALMSLSKLSNTNQDIAIKIIDQSISNGWAGLFELKQNKIKGNEQRQNEQDRRFAEKYATMYRQEQNDRNDIS